MNTEAMMKKKTAMFALLTMLAGTVSAEKHISPYPMPDQTAQTDLAIPPMNNGASGQSSGASGLTVEAGTDLVERSPASVRLKPATQGDVTYLCGGVGDEEIAFMKSAARGYDLMLTFAAQDGAYLADVNVDIRDAKGKSVLQTKCDSPMLLVEVPVSGTYRIRAETGGYRLDRIAKVKATGRKGASLAGVTMVWPQQVAEVPGEGGASGAPGGGAGRGGR
jgi:hypothetical protein